MGGRGTHVTEVLPATGAVTRLNLTAARAYVPQGPDKGQSATVGPSPIVVGADATCQLVLTDRSVSRKHAELRRDGAHIVVRDLGSTNGTFYREARVVEVMVPLGGEVLFGKTKVKFVPEEEPVDSKPFSGERLGPLVGADPRMREIFSLIDDISASDATVVIEGETGTGKELVAQAIHERSVRAKGPFVVFDCTSQPKDLMESALFGHVKGAFTGATSPRAGAFERAHKGTVFLDEIGELALDLQPKLLRVLEAREVQPVGKDGYQSVDVRVIAATHRTLRGEVKSGQFREDLYYRLAVVRILLPPLRDRADDIPRLVEHFLAQSAAELSVDPGCYAALKQHAWPGNVRELKNVVQRAVALCRGKQNVDLARFLMEEDDEERASADVPPDTSLSFKEAKGRVISSFESRYIEALLKEHNNNISHAAREAGIDRKHFKDLMRRYGIEARSDDGDDA